MIAPTPPPGMPAVQLPSGHPASFDETTEWLAERVITLVFQPGLHEAPVGLLRGVLMALAICDEDEMAEICAGIRDVFADATARLQAELMASRQSALRRSKPSRPPRPVPFKAITGGRDVRHS